MKLLRLFCLSFFVTVGFNVAIISSAFSSDKPKVYRWSLERYIQALPANGIVGEKSELGASANDIDKTEAAAVASVADRLGLQPGDQIKTTRITLDHQFGLTRQTTGSVSLVVSRKGQIINVEGDMISSESDPEFTKIEGLRREAIKQKFMTAIQAAKTK
jgi:hypothetical protein